MRILRVTGRNDDMLIIRGVNVYPSQIEAVLVGRPAWRRTTSWCWSARARSTMCARRSRPCPRCRRATIRAAADAAHHIKSMVGVSADVQVLAPGAVPRSQGKAVRVRPAAEGEPSDQPKKRRQNEVGALRFCCASA